MKLLSGSPVAALARLFAIAALSGMAGTSVANEGTVTFVESVRCTNITVCDVQSRTIPILETVRAPDVGDYCVEYTRKLTGFRTYASQDPATKIKVPQYEHGEKRYFRCAKADKLASR